MKRQRAVGAFRCHPMVLAQGTLLLLGLGAARQASAQARPSEDELFGGSAVSPGTPVAPGAAAEPPPEPRATEAPSRDADILGGAPTRMFTEQAAPDDPLEIGGQLYLRAQTTGLEGQAPRNWAVSAPTLLDVYLDARPNDRVRGFVLGRMSFDPTLPAVASSPDAIRPIDGSGGTSGSASPSALVQAQTRGPRATLDQLWLRFDVAHTVFVTAGKQHVRWGTGRFWAPTDYLHVRRRNPLDVFDARSGTTLVKLHLPIEARAWNFYAYGVTEAALATPTLGSIAGAARAELVFGAMELGLGAFLRRAEKPKYAADLSAGIGDFDVYGEVALRDGADIDRVQFAENAAVPAFDTPPSWERPEDTARRQLEQVIDAFYPVYRSDGLEAQAVAGVTYSQKYNDNDTFTLGAEYFYNGLGYESPAPYPGLVLPHSVELVDAATFFYLGQQYGALFFALPAPFSLDNHSFTLSTLGNLSDLSFISRVDYALAALTHVRFEAFASVRYGTTSGEFRFGVDQLDIGGFGFSRAPALIDLGVGLRIDI